MKQRIITLLKNNRALYMIYYYCMSTILRIAGGLVSNNHKEILFVCYGGRKYGDNVKPIYERLIEDERFKEWKFIWAFRNEKTFELPDTERTIKCRVDSLKFYYYALRSCCWITNVSVQRGLNFKHNDTIYINTWHGVPLKKIGYDIPGNAAFKAVKPEKFDYFYVEGKYDKAIMPSAYLIPQENAIVTGYPRNDIMFKTDNDVTKRIFDKYGIEEGKKLILYAPTYRDYNKDANGDFIFELKLNSEIFDSSGLADKYVLMVRAHGAIENNNENKGFIDVTDYPNIEDLLVASDILISDFSGVIFDYALLRKPILCFLYDVKTFEEKRGFYVDVESFLPFIKCYTEQELYRQINELDYDEACRTSEEFVQKCGLVWNDATGNAVNHIASLLNT